MILALYAALLMGSKTAAGTETSSWPISEVIQDTNGLNEMEITGFCKFFLIF